MKRSDIPKDVMEAIRKTAEEYWDGDADLAKDSVDTEVEAYIALQKIDFGAAARVRKNILDGAAEAADSWEDRMSIVESEIEAFQELQSGFEGIPDELVEKLKAEAAHEHDNEYGSQRDHVVNGVNAYRYVEELKARIGPVQHLLIKMERIIGDECYNGKIQNYGPGGVWEGEGRSFRYPVKFLDGEETTKHWTVPGNITPDVLMTGRYQFGSNELSIFRALAKIVEMIESDYGVRLSDAKAKK
ncbi:hypothetical protein [Sinorhizobium meliloti]|nr:hypothetical protein U8C39_09570 [Sinorhizobium meliloti]WQP31704.1 hypothetical protein U8C45_09535 [Sinorhizobium meliloti]